ncbi:MAG: hypothetical protein MJ135_05370 [Oscillospiraceae bacterium]|nr:hypothetical protein [Oscillospiraceae bacterium]
MTVINKQKFLAELGKLLTFMYEEDRQIALGLYENMFDTCANEQLLLQHLGTPTRQAVMVARSYNSGERKLQISSDSRSGEDEAQDPQYISVIQNVERAFTARYGNTQQEEVSEDQISLFETFDFITAPEEPSAEEPEQTSLFDLLDEPAESFIRDEPAAEEAAAEETEAAEEPFEPEQAEEPLIEEAAEELPEAQEEAAPEEQPEAKEADFVEYTLEPVQPEEPEEEAEEEEDEEEEPERIPTVRKVKPAMLLLYILLAIPAIVVGTAVLLVPTVLFLLAATAAVILGILIVSFPFGGLTVFADIMLVLGVGIIVLALGFLFLWTFVWLIGGAIVGHIQGVIRLGGKLCYKEVPVK